MYFRKDLRHQDVPQGVAWNCDFYVTICAFPRDQNHFCRNPFSAMATAALVEATQWLRAKRLRLSHDGPIGTVAATGKEPHHLEAARCRSLFSPTLPGRTPARADFSLLAGI